MRAGAPGSEALGRALGDQAGGPWENGGWACAQTHSAEPPPKGPLDNDEQQRRTGVGWVCCQPVCLDAREEWRQAAAVLPAHHAARAKTVPVTVPWSSRPSSSSRPAALWAGGGDWRRAGGEAFGVKLWAHERKRLKVCVRKVCVRVCACVHVCVSVKRLRNKGTVEKLTTAPLRAQVRQSPGQRCCFRRRIRKRERVRVTTDERRTESPHERRERGREGEGEGSCLCVSSAASFRTVGRSHGSLRTG